MYNNTDYNKELICGFKTAAINSTYQSNTTFRPEFISNNHIKGKKVIVSIEEELSSCDDFKISVAFITRSGVTPLLQILKDLENKGVQGKILTTDYLYFSEPEALDTLYSLKNITIRMFRTNDETGGFHTKGYIFRQKGIYHTIIGSSNLTLNAFTRNREWNTKIVSTDKGELTQDILQEFNELWYSPTTQDYSEFIDDYKKKYQHDKLNRKKKEEEIQGCNNENDVCNLKPNKMQIAFIRNLIKLLDKNESKALLTSTTGTGKTLASAFAMKELKSKRILFVVHREQIAKQALIAYKKIFGDSKTYGVISGNEMNSNADFVFSTMQMMAKPEIHTMFDKHMFDAIVLDECHHAGSDSYQRIMSYFKPKFWLGMTGSPDTNNYDIYGIFDHNIAYEIRLQQALEEDLLCPFHYFGITDLEINGEVFDDKAGLENFSNLVSDARVNYILEKAEYYGYSGERVKGLIFCRSVEEARELSLKFNHKHKKDGSFYKTVVLTGNDSQEKREYAVRQLTMSGNNDESIDYIFTRDIFNEGVDIPEVNQVIMLRPTESPVIFVQQLGRGLRKYMGKEYVVILDFIGNYLNNNFMIPIALSGDRSYNKDAMRRYILEGSRIIPGSSTIHFDEISKKRIFSSIDSARTNDKKLIFDSYINLKRKLNKIPSILDFREYGSIDITKIFEKYGSYYAFLKKYEPDYSCTISKESQTIIEYISRKLVSYKRVHEIGLLKYLINNMGKYLSNYKEFMRSKYNINISSVIEDSVYLNLTNKFPKDEEQFKYSSCVFIDRTIDGVYRLKESFQYLLRNQEFKDMVLELLNFGEEKYLDNYNNLYKDTSFQLYQKYTYEDVCRLLGWKKNMNAQNIGGYFYDKDTKTLPVFINYDKTEDAIAYEDRFISENILIALSKHPRKITSTDAIHIYKKSSEDINNRIFLFIRKNKDDNEAKEFYFMGEIFAEGEPLPIHMDTTNDDAFEITYRLDVPVRNDIYDYIVRG